MSALLSIRDLRVSFRMGTADGTPVRVQAVGRDEAGVSFELPENTHPWKATVRLKFSSLTPPWNTMSWKRILLFALRLMTLVVPAGDCSTVFPPGKPRTTIGFWEVPEFSKRKSAVKTPTPTSKVSPALADFVPDSNESALAITGLLPVAFRKLMESL